MGEVTGIKPISYQLERLKREKIQYLPLITSTEREVKDSLRNVSKMTFLGQD